MVDYSSAREYRFDSSLPIHADRRVIGARKSVMNVLINRAQVDSFIVPVCASYAGRTPKIST